MAEIMPDPRGLFRDKPFDGQRLPFGRFGPIADVRIGGVAEDRDAPGSIPWLSRALSFSHPGR